MKLKLAIILV
jgi:mannosyl-oligosaccharide glucosidase